MNSFVLSHDSASYRLVGVISIGVTKIPIVSFGYPEYLVLSDRERAQMAECMRSHKIAIIEIEELTEKMDRVTWSILPAEIEDLPKNKPVKLPLYLYLDLPMESRKDCIGSRLFSETARSEKGFLVSVTAEDQTYLNFYSLAKCRQSSKKITGLVGHLSKFVCGPAVPLLRTIETLRSQLSPQRKIEISDDELGLIYSSLAGGNE